MRSSLRGVAEGRSLLRHHLLGAIVRDALVLDVAQVPSSASSLQVFVAV